MTVFPLQRASMRCLRCNELCDRKSRKRRFCVACGKARAREKLKAYKSSKRTNRKPGSLLVASVVGCESCGVSIQKRTSQHRFCSACRRQSDLEGCRERNQRFRTNNETARRDAARRQRERRSKNPKYAIAARMSAGIYQALRGKKAGRSWEQIVGFKLKSLVLHLERQFLSGMTWNNYGEWHIDHIRPISSFNFVSEADPAFRDCWSLSNLRPMWAVDNRSKSARIEFLL